MQLSPGERSVLAYFPSSTMAQEAAQALQNAGMSEVQVDRISRYGVTYDDHYDNPVNRGGSQSSLSMFSTHTNSLINDDTGIAMGADPSVSGYTPPEFGHAGGRAFLVTVVTNEENADQAAAILRDKGAYM